LPICELTIRKICWARMPTLDTLTHISSTIMKGIWFLCIHLVSSTFNIQFGFLQHFITLKISTFITFQTCALNLIVKTLLSTTFYNFENKCFYNLPNMYLKPHCKNFYEFQWIMANSLTTSLMFFILSKISRL